MRNFLSHAGGEAIGVCENSAERRARAKGDFPSVVCFEALEDVLQLSQCRAVVIATPVSTHYSIAKRALMAGKHVLVEKPLCRSSAEAEELISLADEKGLILMVDHTFLYHPAVQKIKRLVDSGDIGTIRYIDSTRINLGLFQNDVNVIWDLAVHDLSVAQYVIGSAPESVQAIGFSHTPSGLENCAYLILRYRNGSYVHINSSWISPVKVRHVLIGGDKKMILYNDLDANEPVKVYDTGVVAKTIDERSILQYDYRVGDVVCPKIPQVEALRNLSEDFMSAIKGERVPLSTGRFGASLVRILEAADSSLRSESKIIEL
ncbi:Gfo/Idh/MocA family protein [Nibricoccus sp. IMCC34717]|uniref:Gfo/Idh/MocA family protein n=1 Tax=Nibricoccus sp. IMCC34717 TaxID=3034021 RepID=UPI00384DA356